MTRPSFYAENQALFRWSFILAIAVVLNFCLWINMRQDQARWINVPPAPEAQSASLSGLGDTQFSFRTMAYMLQNLGDSGGHARPLKDYNYDLLAKWFFLADHLDARSNFIPYMAAYYFSAVQTPEISLPPLIKYLEHVGKQNGGAYDKWRWLVQAIHLARYKLNDLEWALEMSRTLKTLDGKNGVSLPVWAKNMDIMIMNVKGEKEAAYGILLQTLETEGDTMDQSEYLFTLDYICQQILTPQQARENPLCKELMP